jgi:hypothetical protein
VIPLPGHPEPHTYTWTKLELEAIQAYGDARVAEERERCARVCDEAFDQTWNSTVEWCAKTIRTPTIT